MIPVQEREMTPGLVEGTEPTVAVRTFAVALAELIVKLAVVVLHKGVVIENPTGRVMTKVSAVVRAVRVVKSNTVFAAFIERPATEAVPMAISLNTLTFSVAAEMPTSVLVDTVQDAIGLMAGVARVTETVFAAHARTIKDGPAIVAPVRASVATLPSTLWLIVVVPEEGVVKAHEIVAEGVTPAG